MNTYDDKHIKNIALVGAPQSGMTTLAEAMQFEAGEINRIGTIEDGNTVSDYHEIEKEKGFSVYTTPLHLEWKDYKINILDAPGAEDFISEALKSIRIAETSVLVINAQKGVEVTTEVLWRYIDKMRKSTILAVNQLDHPQADWDETLNSMRSLFGNRMLPMQFPVSVGPDFHEIVDALTMTLYRFSSEGGKPEKQDIPEQFRERAEEMHREIVEAAAANKEELLEQYFEKGTLSEEELKEGLKLGMMNHELFPVFCLSAKLDMGSGRLMGFIDYAAPSASEIPPYHNSKENTSVFIYKTAYEPNLGRVNYFKVLSGKLKAGDKLKNQSIPGNPTEVFGQLYMMDGKKRTAVEQMNTGDLGAVLKLKETEHDQTLSVDGKAELYPATIYPEDQMIKAVVVDESTDVEKVAAALRRLEEQDPSFRYSYDTENQQMLVGCQGELHLDVNRWILKNEYGLDVTFEAAKIAYRESITRSAMGSYRHKKQSGGAGQFAEVKIRIEPWTEGMADPEGFPVRGKELTELPWGGKLEVINSIVGGVIDTRFIPSIQKGIIEAMEHGHLQESPIQDVRVIIFDGKMHPVDSNDMAFKTAGYHAFKLAMEDAKAILLEPVMEITITVPDSAMGDVMTEVQSRRGIILGMEPEGKFQKLMTHIPKAETEGLSSQLRSLTHGQAGFKTKFHSLRPAPGNYGVSK